MKRILMTLLAAGCSGGALDTPPCAPSQQLLVNGLCADPPDFYYAPPQDAGAPDLASSLDFDFTFDFQFPFVATDMAQIPDDLNGALPAQCSGTSDALYLDGDSFNNLFQGMQTITSAKWNGMASAAMPTEIDLNLTPTDYNQGAFWYLTFSTTQLGTPMTTQTYFDAERAGFEEPGHPGIDISSSNGCDSYTGSFRVFDLTMNGNTLASFTATFDEHCDGNAPGLRGCVHFQQ